MSADPFSSDTRGGAGKSGDPRAPLPPWNDSTPSSKVPPKIKHPTRHVAPQLETVLKALGVVLIVTAIVGAVLVALPDGGGGPSATATPDPALVIAASNQTGEAAASIASPAASIGYNAQYAEFVVCLDPGHGGDDRGHQRAATSTAAAMDESYFNLAIAKALRDRLEQRGFKVVMTRSDDVVVNADDFDANNDGQTGTGGTSTSEAQTLGDLDEFQSRIDRCNDAKADLMISIHVDGSADPAVRGSTIWFSKERSFAPLSQLMATMLFEELGLQLPATGYDGSGQGVFDEAGLEVLDDGHALQQFLLLGAERDELKEPSAMPGVVAEVLTITNDGDALFLSTEFGLESTVLAFDQAIVRFVDMTQRQ